TCYRSLKRNKWQVGIFTLSCKTWKMIPSSNVLRESIRLMSSTPVAIDRFIYWFSQDRIVANYGVLAEKPVYGIWMMGEQGGVMTSFAKLFNIKTPPDDSPVTKVLGFTMSGEPIMETEKDNGEFVTVEVYKPCSEHKNDLGINGEHGSIFICPYTETLLLVDHSDSCIISNDS
nr:hypothetical protein [Tanacetum cinerariifolium]